MRPSVWEKIADTFISNEIITIEDRQLYTYGLQQGILIILNIATTIVIGIIFKMVLQSLIFLFAYIPLRSYAGGYHAKNQATCYVFSIFIMSIAFWQIKYISWTSFICLLLTLGAGVIIFLLAPVEDSNKPLDCTEKVIYKKRTRAILSLLLLITILSYNLGKQQISICIIMALVTLSIMLVLGRVKNILRTR